MSDNEKQCLREVHVMKTLEYNYYIIDILILLNFMIVYQIMMI